ncbi:hypothetical protein M422DRAFT_782140 [Sphaerobolus stellatus SS14]|uniref:Maltose/galactoside acetyltransferase domain-containing protein n=1 Tax=Sphaerobolus stellatus (strain SS14) TaxID=990650 RepID=A0A0C9VGY0_SPHS4|nr:hypothetical protein M422DRAFT_782140 [Sphaerobolus stellatus SS14]
MERCLPYDGVFDDELLEGRLRTKKYMKAYNEYPAAATFQPGIGPSQFFGPDERLQNLAELLGLPLERIRRDIFIEPPFYCDYGTQIEFKGSCYFNYGVTILGTYMHSYSFSHSSTDKDNLYLDAAKVTIGTRAGLDQESTQIYSASHSVNVIERRDLTSGIARSHPVTIGDDEDTLQLLDHAILEMVRRFSRF